MMTRRREFLKTIGAAGLAGMGLAATGSCAASAARRLDRIGMQLYTVRAGMQETVEGTLARVAEIGYADVEFAGYFDRSAAQIRRVLDDTGLGAPSTHLALEALEGDWEAIVDFAATVGHQYLVVPSIPPAERTGLDDYRRTAERLNRVGERARGVGLTVGYHNHAFEFEPLDGRVPWDVLVEETDAALVALELDLYWITSAGADPLANFREHAGRFPMVHVKDMAADGSMVAVGEGTIDFGTLFASSDQAGIRHYFVEHDSPEDPFASLATSYRYLRDLRF